MLGEWQEKCIGMAGMARKVFRHRGNGKTSVKAEREWQDKCLGVAGMARKVFWRSGNGKTSV